MFEHVDVLYVYGVHPHADCVRDGFRMHEDYTVDASPTCTSTEEKFGGPPYPDFIHKPMDFISVAVFRFRL